MAQKIKYQTTTVEPSTSAAAIQKLVQKYGGSRCEIRWEPGTGRVIGVRFALPHERIGEVPISLTAQAEFIFNVLHKEVRRTGRFVERNLKADRVQADRIAWRQLKDFTEQALLAVHTGLFPVHSAFMHAIETGEMDEDGNPETLGNYFEAHATIEGGRLMLGTGEPVYEVEPIPTEEIDL